jgi:hypothetical protein
MVACDMIWESETVGAVGGGDDGTSVFDSAARRAVEGDKQCAALLDTAIAQPPPRHFPAVLRPFLRDSSFDVHSIALKPAAQLHF